MDAKISKEKQEWMKKVGIKEFAKPMKYYLGTNMFFSEEYIEKTPLEILQEEYDESLISNCTCKKLDRKAR